MNRVIKFRGKRIDNGEWAYGFWGTRPDGANFICPFENYESYAVHPESVGQFTGLTDKEGKEIYEGDIVRCFNIELEWQTHTGDNIPMGSYTEPCGIKAEIVHRPVVFFNGEFTILEIPNEDEEENPNEWNWLRSPKYYSRSELNYIFFPHYHYENSQTYPDSDFIEIMNDIVETLGIKADSIEDFIKKVNGIEVIGNIYQNPELIK